MRWTPVELEVILHFYYCPFMPERLSPAYEEAIAKLERMKMLTPHENAYQCTKKGRAFVEALCKTPEPKCMWVVK